MKEQSQKLRSKARLKSSALFLDRDGVINKRIVNGYVLSRDDFVFIDGVCEALSDLSKIFRHIFIVTNQQCVGKKLISIEELDKIHSHMIAHIKGCGGRINDVFMSTDLASEKSKRRKPNTGMAREALEKYPSIVLRDSIMVGDSASDMLFAKRSGMLAVHAGSVTDKAAELADITFASLKEFSDFLTRDQLPRTP